MEVSVADEIRTARNSHGDLDDASWAASLAEHSAFMFLERAEEDSLWGTYFAPMAEWTTSDGGRTVQPDVAKLNEGTVQHWEERAGKTTNPVLRARYADCVWDLERAITGGKRQHKFAIVAAQSYIETAKRDGFAGEIVNVAALPRALSIAGVQMLARAVQLAQSINARELATAAASEMIAFCSRHGDPAHAGVWLAPFDTLHGQKDLLTAEQEDMIIRDLETMLERTSSTENGKDFNPFGAQSAAERLSKHYKTAEETKRVVQVYGSAFESMARDASPMLAMAWMQPVIERYQQVGLKSESERLANAAVEKGKRIGEDLKTYSIEVPIERELIDKETNALLAGTELNLKLFRIGLEFTPMATQVKKSLDFARENTPLLTLIGQNIINADGQTTARIGSLDDDLEGRLQRQTADHIGMLQLFLSHALSELKLRDGPTANQIVDVLYECPLFSERRKGLITEGIAAYLGQDWVKAIHVLVPQMEEILRNLLAEIGVPVSKTVRNNPGVTDLKNMGDVLSDERIKVVLGEDRWRYLSVLYIDRRGINLRNQVAHGLVSHEGFNPYIADLVFHSFLSVCTLRKAKETAD
jgi:hypothetical protein